MFDVPPNIHAIKKYAIKKTLKNLKILQKGKSEVTAIRKARLSVGKS